ncbi:MAG: hypothetical protein GX625_11050 [Clostridiaceae bacterium]|nr:hypothetical protein [Clostridiaceae bacterium]
MNTKRFLCLIFVSFFIFCGDSVLVAVTRAESARINSAHAATPSRTISAEVDFIFSLEDFMKFYEGNPLGVFIKLAKKRVAIEGEISDISGFTASMDTGWIYGRVDFVFPHSKSGIASLKKGKTHTIIGSFAGYGHKESTLIFDDCSVTNEIITKRPTDSVCTYQELLTFYKGKKTSPSTKAIGISVGAIGSVLVDAAGSPFRETNFDQEMQFGMVKAWIAAEMILIPSHDDTKREELFNSLKEASKSIFEIKQEFKSSSDYGGIKEFSATELEAAFEENYFNALKMCEDGFIVEGTIKSISGCIASEVGVLRLSTGYFSDLACLFYAEPIMELAKFKKGDTIKVFGMVMNREEEILLFPTVVF